MAARHSRWLLPVAVATSCAVAANSKVTVHLVPHTHDDVGWLKTVDQYYAGLNNTIQHANVKLVISTVVQALLANPERKFTYVEQAFLVRWWNEQSDAQRQVVKDLVAAGRLSFTNGGWCMHDEAAPFYLDMIDQTTLGHRFLNDTFGFSPKTGWQLDPFGHSATQAALLSAEVGLSGLFFGRIDYQDLDARKNASAAEFIWRASPSLGPGAQVFAGLTGSYQGNYGPPPGFNFDGTSTDQLIQDDPRLEDYNVKSRIDDFVAAAFEQAKMTRGSHVMLTMGSDFHYENAFAYFDGLDKLVKYGNEDGRVQVVYSTPEKYLAAKMSENEVTWPLKTDDFFPYADGPHMFWTGYFTSRPSLKRYIRESSAALQVFRQLVALGAPDSALGASDEGLAKFEEAMGVAQHHDAVSGTAKQHVTFDYEARLARGRAAALPAATSALRRLLGGAVNFSEVSSMPLSVCDLRNVSVCAATQSGASMVILWNGLAQSRSEVIELPIDAADASVETHDGKEVPSQVVPSLPSVTNYGRPAGGGKSTVLFHASVPPMGFAAFRLRPAALGSSAAAPSVAEASVVAAASAAAEQHEAVQAASTTTLENEFLSVSFDGRGALAWLTEKATGLSVKAKQSWLYYNSSLGQNQDSDQPSGAYIFRPFTSETFGIGGDVDGGRPTSFRVVRGAVADEVHQDFGSWVSQRIRLAKGARHVEVTYTVGPIPVGKDGKEVVTRFATDIANDGACYTDSNGREMIPRKRDFRASWKLNQTEPVAGNYYPVTTSLFIKDASRQLTVLTDAAQAATGSVSDGQLELMVHRRVLGEDRRGVGELLNETEFVKPYAEVAETEQGLHFGQGLVIRGRHFLTVGAPELAAEVWRPLADSVYMPLAPFFAPSGEQLSSPSETFSALRGPLPPNVQIVSLQQWDKDRVLLRLAHQFGLGEDAVLSKPVQVDVGSLFAARRVVSLDERGLSVAISRSEVLRRRFDWPVEGAAGGSDTLDAATDGATSSGDGTAAVDSAAPSAGGGGRGGEGFVVRLGPLEVKTLLLKLAPSAAEEDEEDLRLFPSQQLRGARAAALEEDLLLE